MAPLIALLASFVVAWLVFRRRPDPTLPGRVALAVMLVVTASAHFVSTDALVAMVPPVLPMPVAIVYATGVAELGFALLLVARPSPQLGWALVAFFLALLPANIYAAVREVGLGGHGAAYLWFRVPLQLLFIGWALHVTGAARVLPRRGSTATPG